MTDNNIYNAPAPKPRLYYGYVIVAASFIIMILAQGLYIIFGVFINPLLEEFGWTKATISGAFSLSTILQGVLGIVMGGLVDRFGPRIVVTVCGVFLGAWVTTIIKILVSVRGDVRKREKVRFRPRKGGAISLNG